MCNYKSFTAYTTFLSTWLICFASSGAKLKDSKDTKAFCGLDLADGRCQVIFFFFKNFSFFFKNFFYFNLFLQILLLCFFLLLLFSYFLFPGVTYVQGENAYFGYTLFWTGTE